MFGLPRPTTLRLLAPGLLLIAALSLDPRPGAGQNLFQQTNLVSDLPGLARTTDASLVNPWGISFSATSPFWLSNNGTGTSTLYNTAGVKQPLTVSIPAPGGGAAAPTGTVFNGTGAFAPAGGVSPRFLFATEDGTITGWHPTFGTTAHILVDNSGSGAIYKGIATSGSGAAARLYATNFHAGSVDVFDSNLSMLSLPGAFTDPNLPAGYSPFNVENIGGKIFVTYAQRDATGHDDVPGPGHGFVDVYDTGGILLQRLVSGGPLDSPWGLALAPSGFGPFGGMLLIGNFGNGAIDAFNPVTGAFIGALHAVDGTPLEIQGLWGLAFGNGGNGGDPNNLYFAAGIPGPDGNVEDHGLFGSLQPTPEPGSLALLAMGLLGLLGSRRRRRLS